MILHPADLESRPARVSNRAATTAAAQWHGAQRVAKQAVRRQRFRRIAALVGSAQPASRPSDTAERP